jgi:hypothetical protein
MASINFNLLSSTPPATPVPTTVPLRAMHRLRTVREQQGVSLRTVARHTGFDVRTLRVQEEESCDLRLSELYSWQVALDVPVCELLVETETPLSRPVMERARLIRIMKTAAAILEHAPNSSIQRMAETLIAQLIEIMPELKQVGAWPTYGQRRSLEEFGRIMEQRMSDDALSSAGDEE